ncbi:zinc finger HIT domain-containing protein 2 [Pseudophryne corroboree]|uniref:zinc finger HIT domain-containing protein 2 n=1 Tax=Pseudophryne corroboree TaxID=495146 RepID=UPI0030820128
MEVPGQHEIIIPARSTSPTPAIQPPRGREGSGCVLCSLCLSGPGKYTCPRCNAPYCSLACYTGARHTACSELFYRESVLQALREEKADPRERRQMEEMLLTLRERVAAVETAPELRGVIAGEEADLWDSLTPQEKEDFRRLVHSGDIGCLVPEWKPWWDSKERHGKITELPEPAGSPQTPMGDQMVPSDADIVQGDQPVSSQQQWATDHRLRRGPLKHGLVPSCDPEKSGAPTCAAEPATVPLSNPNTGCPGALHVTALPEHVSCYLEDAQTGSSNHTGSDSNDATNKPCTHQQGVIKSGVPERTTNSDKIQDVSARACPRVVDQSKVSRVPPLLRSIPPLSSLSRNPSPLVRYSLVNVLYSYAFSLLQHNGDLSDNSILLNFTGTLLCVSAALTTTIVYNSTAHAIKSAVRAASDPLLGGDESGACLAIAATSNILRGDGSKRYSLAALSHLSRLLGKTRKLEAEEKDMKTASFNAKKKCLFLAAWVNENETYLPSLSAEVMTESKQYLKDLSEVAEISKQLQKAWGGKRPPERKKLIQVVNSPGSEL